MHSPGQAITKRRQFLGQRGEKPIPSHVLAWFAQQTYTLTILFVYDHALNFFSDILPRLQVLYGNGFLTISI